MEFRRSKGLPGPEKPELNAGLELAWQAFAELHDQRQYGLGPNPIALRDITAWLDLYGIEGGERKREYFSRIKALDIAWLEWVTSKDKKDDDKDDKEAKKSRQLGDRKRSRR